MPSLAIPRLPLNASGSPVNQEQELGDREAEEKLLVREAELGETDLPEIR